MISSRQTTATPLWNRSARPLVDLPAPGHGLDVLAGGAANSVMQVNYCDPDRGWRGTLAIDRIVEGAAIGGVRMTPTVHAGEVTRLARGMTLKTAALGLVVGGAKVGIEYDPASTTRRDALLRFFEHIRPMCESWYAFGPDMNTSSAELDEIAHTVGLTWRLGPLASAGERAQARARYDSALALPVGPFTVETLRTGAGTAAAVERAAQCLGINRPLTFAVHGFGVVGSAAAWSLCQNGHRMVSVADAGGSYTNYDGIDPLALHQKRTRRGLIDRGVLSSGVVIDVPEEVLYADVDVLILAATPDVITGSNVDRVKASFLVEGGNIAITTEASQRLHEREVLVVPDYIASGGAVAMGVGVVRAGFPSDDGEALIGHITDLIADATERGYRASRDRGIPMRLAALPDLTSAIHRA